MERNSDYVDDELVEELDDDLDNIDIHDDYITQPKSTSKFTFKEQPVFWGGIGILFLFFLIAMVLGNKDSSINEEPGSTNERLEKMEQRIALIVSTLQDGTSPKPRLGTLQKSLSELELSVRSLRGRVDNLGQKVTSVEKELASVRSTIKSQTTKGTQAKSAVNVSKHVVKSRDTLYNISKKYGTTVEELRRLNNLKKDQNIYPGQELVFTETGG